MYFSNISIPSAANIGVDFPLRPPRQPTLGMTHEKKTQLFGFDGEGICFAIHLFGGDGVREQD
jgi:hypothetical protein